MSSCVNLDKQSASRLVKPLIYLKLKPYVRVLINMHFSLGVACVKNLFKNIFIGLSQAGTFFQTKGGQMSPFICFVMLLVSLKITPMPTSMSFIICIIVCISYLTLYTICATIYTDKWLADCVVLICLTAYYRLSHIAYFLLAMWIIEVSGILLITLL